MNEMSNNVLDNLLFLLEKRKSRKLANRIGSLFKTSGMELEQIGDLIGEVMKRDSDFFMDHVFQPLLRQIRKTPYISDLDLYILKKFCLLQGEEILLNFYGSVFEKKVISTGRIYLTNYRLIVSGTQEVQSAQKRTGRPSLVGSLVRSGVTRHRKNVRKAITKALRQGISEFGLPEWGYVFPITGAYNIMRGKGNASYSLTIETENKPMKMNVKVIPKRLKKLQTKPEFQSENKQIFDQLIDLLNQYKNS